MIGRIAVFVLLLTINYAILIYSWFFMSGSLDVESISEKIGILCCMLSFCFPIVTAAIIVNELIRGGLL